MKKEWKGRKEKEEQKMKERNKIVKMKDNEKE